MSTKRGFLAGVAMGALGGFSGANVLMRGDETDTEQEPRENDSNTTDGTPGGAPAESPFDASAVAGEVASLVNAERESVYGGIVPELSYNDTLAQCAAQHAEAMAESGSVAHGETRARYNQFGLGVQIPNETVAEKINSDWENIASADTTEREAAGIASALVEGFDEDVMLYRPWSIQGVGVVLDGSTVYAAVNYL